MLFARRNCFFYLADIVIKFIKWNRSSCIRYKRVIREWSKLKLIQVIEAKCKNKMFRKMKKIYSSQPISLRRVVPMLFFKFINTSNYLIHLHSFIFLLQKVLVFFYLKASEKKISAAIYNSPKILFRIIKILSFKRPRTWKWQIKANKLFRFCCTIKNYSLCSKKSYSNCKGNN